jgi:hypothetical protein
MGTGVTLSTKPPENLKELLKAAEGFENRIVKPRLEELVQARSCSSVNFTVKPWD